MKIQDKLVKCFSYALASGSDIINPVKGKVLVAEEEDVCGDNVVVHRLASSQKLDEVVAGHSHRQLTKALVIVNTTESLKLESACTDGYEGSNYPVIIVSCSDGKEILSLMENEDRTVVCDIETMSTLPDLHQTPDPSQVAEKPTADVSKGFSWNPLGGRLCRF